MIRPIFNVIKDLTVLQCIGHIIKHNLPNQAIIYTQINLGPIEFPRVNTDFSSTFTSNRLTKSIDLIVARFQDHPTTNKMFRNSRNLSNFDADTWYFLIGVNFTSKNLEMLKRNFIFKLVLLDEETNRLLTIDPTRNVISERKIGIRLYEIGLCQNTHELHQDLSPSIWKNTSLQLLYHPIYPFGLCPDCDPEGIEVEILNTIFEVLGVTPNYLTEGKYEIWDNLRKRSDFDLYFGSIAAREPIDEYLFPYILTDVHFLVPSPERMPRWKFIFRIFSWEVFLLYFTSLVAISCVESLKHQKKRFKVILRIIQTSFKLSLDQSVVSSFFFQRWLLFLITILSFFLNAIFKCGFTYLITGDNFEKSIESLEDILESNLKIGATPQMINLLKKSQSNFLESRFIPCRILQICLNRTAYSRDLIAVVPLITFKAIRRTYLDKYGKDLMQPLKTAFRVFHVSARIPRGHPIYSIMDTYSQRMVEHGLVDKIILKYTGWNVGLPNFRLRRLTFAQISGAVVLWAIGFVSGCVMFVAEIGYSRKKLLEDITRKKTRI